MSYRDALSIPPSTPDPRGRRIDWPAATAADPEQKRRRTRIAPDVDTLFETYPDVNAFFETQWDSKGKIISFASDRTTRITFPDPKAREIKSAGHILASKVGQHLGRPPLECPPSPKAALGGSQPPSRDARDGALELQKPCFSLRERQHSPSARPTGSTRPRGHAHGIKRTV